MLCCRARQRAPRSREVPTLPGDVFSLLWLFFTHQPVPAMRVCYSLFALFVLAAVPAQGQNSIYLKLGDIKGESTSAAYPGEMILEAFSHTLTAQVQLGGGTGAGKPIHEPIFVTKMLGQGSVPVIELLNKGEVTKDATFSFVRPTGVGVFEYLEIKLENVYITSYSLNVSSGGVPVESFSLVYERITWTYTPQNDKGAPGTPITTTYDVATNTSLVASLSAFEAKPEGDDVLFRWQTDGESGIYGFELQQWQDGDFRRASYVPGGGWSSKNLAYELRVRGLEKGIHTFRLAVLGVDGAVSYSREVEVAVGVPDGADLVVAPYPNPFTEGLHVAVAVARVVDARITVSDLLGREVAVVFDGVLEPGGQRVFDYAPEGTLAAGMYAVRVETGGKTTTRMVSLLR